MTAGEVLLSSSAVEGTGQSRTINAEVAGTFPLDIGEGMGATAKRPAGSSSRPPICRLRPEAVYDPLRCGWEEMGAVRGLGCGYEWGLVQPVGLGGWMWEYGGGGSIGSGAGFTTTRYRK